MCISQFSSFCADVSRVRLALVVASVVMMTRGQRVAAGTAPAAKPATVFVSPAGNDAWSGSLPEPNAARTDGPLATVQAARDLLRARKANGARTRPVAVVVRGGFYPQTEALVFTPEDSGTAEAPVTYQAYPGEHPVISGGVQVSGWQPDHGAQSRTRCADKLWHADAPPGVTWRFNQLFVDGKRRVRARTPNKGAFFRTEAPVPGNKKRGFYFRKGEVREWSNLPEVVFVVYHAWETSLHHVRYVDPEAGAVVFVEPAPWPMGRWERQQRYYVENVFEALDQPGEWYLDRKRQRVYYYPLPGEDMTQAQVIAPRLTTTLVSFRGHPAKKRFVEYLRFKGLTFAHTNANLRRVRNPGQGEIYQSALVTAVGLRHTSFENCEIAHTGAHAMWFSDGCEDCRVQHCHLHDLGGGGVYIGGGWGIGENAPTGHITVDNNFIHDGGYQFHGAHGVWIGRSSYNTVTHNEISNFDYSGISCGWSWGFAPSSANHNHLDSNHIHHLGNGDGLTDMGGIYTLGVSPGTTERNNLIHDVWNYAPLSHGSGLYLDEGSTGILLENNIVYRVRTCPLFMHYGKECRVYNNILALGGDGQLRRCREDKRCHYVAEGNIVYGADREMLSGPWTNGDFKLARNLYWSTAGPPTFKGMDLAAWQAKGHDQGSLVADPLFVSPETGDFRLQPDSPAAKIGFQPIPVDHIGLQGEPEWVDLPKKYPNRRLNEIPKPAGTSQAVNVDFESDEVDAEPVEGRAVNGSNGASVRVSADTAVSGRHSLKFTDAPGQRYEWTPHVYYRPTYESGEIKLSWDMLNSGKSPASFYVEVRQWDVSPYLVGPTVSVAADGTVTASGRTVGRIPLGQWVHVAVDLSLGKDAPAMYKLTLKVPGQKPTSVRLPYQNQTFKKVTWLGVSSTSEQTSVFYLDNLKMGTAEELARPPRRRPRPPSARRRKAPAGGAPSNDRKLVGQWTFAEGEGYVAEDSSGHGNDGDVWGRWATGPFGTALYCDGKGVAVSIPDSPSLRFGEGDFTLEMWLCPTHLAIDAADARRRLLDKSDYPRNWWNVNLSTSGQPFLEMGTSRETSFASRPQVSIRENEWTHLVIVVDRGHRKLEYYLNGALATTFDLPDTFVGPLDARGHDLSLGSSWHSYIGLLDEVRIYRRTLTAVEIKAHYDREKTGRGNAKYKLVE